MGNETRRLRELRLSKAKSPCAELLTPDGRMWEDLDRGMRSRSALQAEPFNLVFPPYGHGPGCRLRADGEPLETNLYHGSAISAWFPDTEAFYPYGTYNYTWKTAFNQRMILTVYGGAAEYCGLNPRANTVLYFGEDVWTDRHLTSEPWCAKMTCRGKKVRWFPSFPEDKSAWHERKKVERSTMPLHTNTGNTTSAA